MPIVIPSERSESRDPYTARFLQLIIPSAPAVAGESRACPKLVEGDLLFRTRQARLNPPTQPALTLVIPVYNEGANFPALWEAVSSHIRSPFRALVVYDFDEDNTVPIVQQIIAQGERRLVLVKNDVGRGVVGAIRTGFNHVDDGPVLVVMADLSDDLSQVDTMLDYYRQGYKVVVGSRYMRGGRLLDAPPLKGLMSRGAGLTLRWFRRIPTHDATNAFKLYDSRMLNSFTIESKAGFELNLELTVKAFLAGHAITEIPTTWRNRTQGESRFRVWAWLPQYLKWYFYAFRPRRQSSASPRDGIR